MKAWLRFFRLPNLLIIVLAQYLIRHAVLGPLYDRAGVSLDLSSWQFAALVLTTVLVTAGGYVVNDLYDGPADRLNRPDRVFIGVRITRMQGLICYAALAVAGFCLAAVLAVQLDMIPWLTLHPLSVLLLWAYSSRWKRGEVLGNVVVSLFSAGVAPLVLLAEHRSFGELAQLDSRLSGFLAYLFVCYAAFAFLGTWFRELVKDLEDVDGDRALGCRTLPIVRGERAARWLAGALLGLLALSLVVFVALSPVRIGTWSLAYFAACLLLPIAVAAFRLHAARDSHGYHGVSTHAKWILLAGLLALPVLTLA